MQQPSDVQKPPTRRRVRGALPLLCPECGKPTRSNLRCGRDVSFCTKCEIWFITTNEPYTEKLMNFYQIFPEET